MQVDALFIQNSNISSKRSRSSMSPSPLERQPKRMSMGLESNSATPSYAHRTLPEDVAMNEDLSTENRGRSEDWVARTGGLRLNSPSLSTYSNQWLHTTPIPECKECNLSTNTDTILAHSTNTLLNNNLVSESLYDRYGSAAHQKVVDIDIDLHMDIASSLLTSSKESIGNVPSSSGLWLSAALTTPLPQSPRKSKLKMGRRADCDKCRLGVKGHWIHID